MNLFAGPQNDTQLPDLHVPKRRKKNAKVTASKCKTKCTFGNFIFLLYNVFHYI